MVEGALSSYARSLNKFGGKLNNIRNNLSGQKIWKNFRKIVKKSGENFREWYGTNLKTFLRKFGENPKKFGKNFEEISRNHYTCVSPDTSKNLAAFLGWSKSGKIVGIFKKNFTTWQQHLQTARKFVKITSGQIVFKPFSKNFGSGILKKENF